MKYFNWLTELYGSEEKRNKRPISVGFYFLVMVILMLIPFIFVDTDTISKIAMIYGASIFGSSAYFSFCSYFFSKKEKKENLKEIKYIFFLSSVLLLAIVFLPVFLVVTLSKKIKFVSFVTHFEKYIIATTIPFFIASILGLLLFINLHNVTWLNPATISMLVAFVLWRLLAFGVLKLFSKFSKNFHKQDYLSIKKDLNVLIFAAITVVTILTNCIKFNGLNKELVEGIAKAFAIYIAIDRLYGKWKGFNSSFEKEKEQITSDK